MKFINNIDKLLNEIDGNQTLPNPDSLQPNNNPANITAVPQPDTPESDVEVTKLSPESEVLLVRLLKKALATKISDEDVTELDDFNDINESNAKQALTRLINVMKKYTNDIDIDTTT